MIIFSFHFKVYMGTMESFQPNLCLNQVFLWRFLFVSISEKRNYFLNIYQSKIILWNWVFIPLCPWKSKLIFAYSYWVTIILLLSKRSFFKYSSYITTTILILNFFTHYITLVNKKILEWIQVSTLSVVLYVM